MADPPPIRRSTVNRPPPIPSARAPVAPPAANTDIAPIPASSADLSEITRNLEAPDAGQLVERMLDLVATEAEALLAGDDADGRLADLNVRTALASWDALGEPDEAMRVLELAERHPLAARLRLSAALGSGEPAALAAVQARLEANPSPATATLVLDVAEAWLWRHDRPDLAGALADRALAAPGNESWRTHALELALLAHTTSGAWQRVIELRRAGIATAPLDEVAATAALVLDRANDPAAALALCWAALERDPSVDDPLGVLRAIDVALAAAVRLGDPRRLQLLEQRARLIESRPGGGLELLATRHAIAGELDRRGSLADAAARWLELADDPAAAQLAAARRIATLGAVWAAAAAGDRATEVAARRKIIDDSCVEVATAHAWRALELAAASDAPVPVLRELAMTVVAHTPSRAAERWLDVLDRSAPTSSTSARFEKRGGGALRWAAVIAERTGDVPRALELWRKAGDQLGTERDHVVRLLRAGDDDALGDAYAEWATTETDPRAASALACARGIVELVRGDFIEAEESLKRAAELDPKDPFCRAALAAVYRAGKHYDLLARVLGELSTSLTSREGRAAAAREAAELLDEHLGDPAGARAAFERMIADRPDDGDAMLAFAKLLERDSQWERSLELRKRAAVLAATPDRCADIWIEIALREDRRGEHGAALAALDQAATANPKRTDVAHERIRIYRDTGRLDLALGVVRGELATDPPVERRMQLQLDQARLLTALGIEPEHVVGAYLDVLEVERDHVEALAGIEAPARKLGLWDELARAFRGASQTPRNLEVLGDALEKIAEWSELAEVRRRQLESASSPSEKSARAADLAKLYEQELGDSDAAIRALQVAQSATLDEARQHTLVRLLRSAQRWSELAAALERELPTIKPEAVPRQLEVLLELGELRADKLNKPAEAAQAFEAVLVHEPHHATAIAALEKLYETLGRDRELARTIEARAESTTVPSDRAALFTRVAMLRQGRNDIDGALAAYAAAFDADPTNRETFTAMERVCYKAERWAAAMQLYDTAILHVESGTSRAYRLGDLYSRRGNVQLSFLGQLEAATASYQKVVEVDSAPAAAIKILEDLCARRRDWHPLIAAWEQRADLQRDPVKKAEALRAAGKIVSDHGSDPRQTMQLSRKLLALDPADRAAAIELERYYEEQDDATGLIDVLKMRLQSAQSGEETIELLKKIARASEEGARDVATATEHYQKVLELQPDNRDALDALGRIYETTEQWAELIDVTRRLIKVTNDRNTKSLLYFKCGSVMEAKFGREQDAIRYYDAAIKTSASCLPAVHGLRDLYRRREEWARVIETLEMEVKLWSDDKERAGVFAQIGRIYEHQLGDPERGMTYYESALTVDPECLPANQALFDHFFDEGAWDKAQALASSLAQKAMREGDPTTRSDFYRKRGVVARMTGDWKAAADSLVVALEVKPTNTAALDDLGDLARERPDAWDFDATYRELEKVYKKRDDASALIARVYVGRAAVFERDGDLDQAAGLYRQALELAPTDGTVLSALVDFHADMRHWREAVEAIQLFVTYAGSSPGDRLAALMRQAAIHADGEMDATSAIAVLDTVLQLEPGHQDAHYSMAQQFFLIGRFAEARAAIDRVIELATAPGQPLSPEALARYYYYKGRILDASGEGRAAAPQYRRAIEYDPGYAPPALVLARRAADAGDQRQAETLLIEAAHAAMAQGGPRAAVPLQRGLARILLSSGDRPAAIEAYRGILNVEPDGASDRVALAEIYAVDDPQRAIGELRKVLDRDIHHAPAYRLLASFYNRTGDIERATRVLTALDLLGFAEDTDRNTMQRLRALRHIAPLRRTLDEDHRVRVLSTPAARAPLGDVWTALAEQLSAHVTQPSLGENLKPAATFGDARLRQVIAEIAGLFNTDADVFVGEKVPGLAAATAFPRRLVVIDRTLLDEHELALRFLFGYAFEAIRGGYAALLQLGARSRHQLAQLLRDLVAGDAEPNGFAAELIHGASPRALKMIERHAGAKDLDAGAWIDGMLACAKRAGLVACDDFAAAVWMVARLSGERPAGHDETVALGAVLGGPDLVRFYLSDDYQLLRDALTMPV